jgi:hypothetical protein
LRFLPHLLAATLVVAGCSGTADETTTTTTAPPAPTSTIATTTTVVTTTTAAPLTTRQLFDRISRSVAFISTDLSTGSGVLLEGGWVVTNAHVVWPFDRVRVVFPDGSEYPATPVVRTDVYEDLAVLGPLESREGGLRLTDGADYGVGDTVFLIGYPGEVEDFPDPAITQGVVSRIRLWAETGLRFIQTDALIAGGQSGGALISADGALLGVSGLGGFSDGNFALVAVAADLESRVAALIDGSSPERFTVEPFPTASAAQRHDVELASFWHDAVFILDAPVSTRVSISVDSPNHTVVATDSLGFNATDDEEPTDSVEFTIQYAEPHFVFVNALVAGPSRVTVDSSHPLAPWTDRDDDVVIARGDVVRGVIDISGEYDVYRIDLAAGESITVTVDGLLDPTVFIDQIGNADEPLAFDYDSGGGLFGYDASVEFTASEAGEFLVIVSDEFLEPAGGYVLTVE